MLWNCKTNWCLITANHPQNQRWNLKLCLTFLHHTPPPLGPVTQLQSVALLYLCPLLKATDHLITQPMPVIYPLHCPFIVPWLQRKKAHIKMHFLILYLLVCLATVSYQQANISVMSWSKQRWEWNTKRVRGVVSFFSQMEARECSCQSTGTHYDLVSPQTSQFDILHYVQAPAATPTPNRHSSKLKD